MKGLRVTASLMPVTKDVCLTVMDDHGNVTNMWFSSGEWVEVVRQASATYRARLMGDVTDG